MEVNGRHYSLWGQFVDRKKEWIGGILEDLDGGPPTKITDITLEPNGEDSAFFRVVGDDYSCGFDVRYGGVQGAPGDAESGWIPFGSQYGSFRIKPASGQTTRRRDESNY